MVALFDADSLVWASSYGVEEDIDLAIEKYNDSFTNIIYDLNEIYDISEVITFNNSKGNFRKILDTNYKANRKSSGMPSILTIVSHTPRCSNEDDNDGESDIEVGISDSIG